MVDNVVDAIMDGECAECDRHLIGDFTIKELVDELKKRAGDNWPVWVNKYETGDFVIDHAMDIMEGMVGREPQAQVGGTIIVVQDDIEEKRRDAS